MVCRRGRRVYPKPDVAWGRVSVSGVALCAFDVGRGELLGAP
jgi:hypothetical protein